MEENIEEKLVHKVNEGYTNLSKWLISLSAGIIVFSVNLIKPETTEYLSVLLTWGFGLFVLSILSGVMYVRFGLDNLHYTILDLRLGKEISELKTHNPEDKLGEKKIIVKDRLQYLSKIQKKVKRRFKIINYFLMLLVPIQLWSFIFGVILIAIFGHIVLCN